jgi:hypothetical protein
MQYKCVTLPIHTKTLTYRDMYKIKVLLFIKLRIILKLEFLERGRKSK